MEEIKKEAFELIKLSQYCDNTSCAYYRQVGKGNVCTNSRSKGQMYCNECRNIWVLTKGTMYFDFRTPIDKVIKTLIKAELILQVIYQLGWSIWLLLLVH